MKSVPGALTPGTLVGTYVIEDMLSSGGFGVVYRARDPEQRQVAIKVSKHSARSITAQQLVWQQNEIEALTRLRHPSLVEVLGYGFMDDGRLYLVMEMVQGLVLGQYLQERGPLEVLEALQLTRRIAEALAYCHESKVLHLDLKPANIIVTDPVEPKVKVLDFGLARLSNGFKTHEGGPVAGTLAYMAPECFFGSIDFSEKVDLYSLGTLLYEMVSCILPFPNNASYAALGSLKRAGKMTPLEQAAPLVPPVVAALVRSLLDPDASHRFGGASQLASRLKGLYFDLLHGNTEEGGGGPPALPPELLSSDDAPFVGRAREVALLREAVDSVGERQGRALMLVGEAGMGKSRLISEVLLSQEVSARVLVGYGRCRQLGELVPYSPLREALGQLVEVLLGIRSEPGHRVRHVAGQVLASEAQELRRLVPELSRLLPEGTERGNEGVIVQGLGAERVGKALVHLLTAIGAARPLVLVLEDVHSADEGTLAVLARLTAAPPPGVLLLCTTRPPPRLARTGELEMLTLEALGSEENDHLLAKLAGGASAAVVKAMVQSVPFLASGNPLVAGQIIRDLQLGGYLARESDGRVRLSDRLRGEYRPPDSVSTVVGRSLERLDEEVLRVLRVAALMDRRFRLSDLEALGVFSPLEVRAAITAAEEQRLCIVVGDRCTFAHDTLRERLVADGRLKDVPDIHRRIGERLRERGAPPGTLGYHWEKAGQPLRSASAYLEAGLDADRLLDPIGASQHLRKAFTVASSQPPSAERDDILVRSLYGLVRIGCLLGSSVEMYRYLELGQALLERPTPEQRLALNSSWARAYYAQGDFPKALEHSAWCLGAATEPHLRSYLYAPLSIMGRALCGSGRFGPATSMLTEAAAQAAAAGEHVEQTHSEGILALALAYCGEFKKAREYASSSARIALRLGNPVRMAASTFYYAVVAEAEFRWDEGVERSAELLAFSEAQGITGLYLCMGTSYAGRHQFHIGRMDRARHLLTHALGLTRQQGLSYGLSLAYAYLGDVEFVAGRQVEAKAAYEKGLELANSGARDEQAGPLCLIGLAHLHALAGGTVEQVRAWADEALSRLRAVDNLSNQIPTLQRYAEALEELGDVAGAARRYEERQVLVKKLGLAECDFWPRPSPKVEPLPPREYWRKASSRLSSSSIKPVSPEDFNAETVVRAAAGPDDGEKKG
ncbi:serine/threonine-protein kinase PknK [Hyalangium sp.]|uniref:serine/threonine-protein kinase n=1 Tax=Hyalangium sp. TaxID=2028555 RepID=UPI002D290AFD|nr:protein kinase [Hyalangium sp.]HYI03142.1 protein kinase [Hyalangium sp.]